MIGIEGWKEKLERAPTLERFEASADYDMAIRVRWKDWDDRDAPSWIDAEIFELRYVPTDGHPPVFLKAGGQHVDDTEDIDEAEVGATMEVKWDGCTELRLCPDNDGQIHMCGPAGYAAWAWAINRVYEIACELMPDDADMKTPMRDSFKRLGEVLEWER